MSLDGRSPDEIRKILGPANKHCLDPRGEECQHSYVYQKIACCDRRLYGGRNPEAKCMNFTLRPDFDVKATQTKWMCPKKVEYKNCRHRQKGVCGLILFGGREPDEDCKSYSPKRKHSDLKGVMRLEEVDSDGTETGN